MGTPFLHLQVPRAGKVMEKPLDLDVDNPTPIRSIKCPSRALDLAKVDTLVDTKVGEDVEKVCFPPTSPVKMTLEGTAKVAPTQAKVADPLAKMAQPKRLQACLPWWEKNAPPFVVQLITKGVEPHFQGQHLVLRHQKKNDTDIKLALEVMEEYVRVGAAQEVPPGKSSYLVPWFVISKTEGEKKKHRLISDCREINQSLCPPKFKLDHWKEIFPVLEPKMWAIKIDLQNAYFHLPLSEAIKQYVHMEIGPKVFQMEGACFGLSTLPYLWMQLMHVFLKKWRRQGLLVFVYLDDILLLARSAPLAQKQSDIMVQDLTEAGMVINFKKSHLQAVQKVEHLGFTLDLQRGLLMVPNQKLKSVRKELGKFLVQKEMSCRKAAAILGQLRSFLTALPCLRAFSDLLVKFTDRQKFLGWDRKVQIPLPLQDQVREIGALLQSWEGRSFAGQSAVRKIYSDSSTQGWGALDVTSGQKLQEFWRSDLGLHINIKELKASIEACQSLAKKGETVFLTMDNSVAYSYLKKEGGRLPPFNSLMRPFLRWCHKNQVKVIPNWVKSSEMLADGLSRVKKDTGDYTLDKKVFNTLCKIFANKGFVPEVDMFASPGNHQLQKWVSRYPHRGACAVNSLECPLSQFSKVYSNPPWKVILSWLLRLKSNPHLSCLTIVPYWDGSPWWPLLTRLHDRRYPVVFINPREGLFIDCLAQVMPPTRWGLLCLVLSGRVYRERKFHLKISLSI